MSFKNFLKSYKFSLILLASIAVGAILGLILKERAEALKPLGDIFLNLLFVTVVPLVFFSIASAVASMGDAKRLGKILGVMILVFIATSIVSSLAMLGMVKIFPMSAEGVLLSAPAQTEAQKLSSQIVNAITVPDFRDLLSRKNMLALIVFAILIGLATLLSRREGDQFKNFLISGNAVMNKAIAIVMLYAPIGLGAYFAYLVGVFGPQLLGPYAKAMAVYYPTALVYFVVAFTCYAGLAGGGRGIRVFWGNIVPPALTAFATGSSVASIPANLKASEKIGVPEDIREVVVPMGATIHMDGSCLSAVLKIAFVYAVLGLDFSTVPIGAVIGSALLSGIVMGGIPGGGFTGELMIMTLFGFPPEALPLMSMIGTLVDPPATMVNSTGDTVSGMMTARVLNGKNWMGQG